MPANFTLSSGASFTVRDQTIHGDTGNTTITDSYNTTTTKVVGSHNTSTTTDNGTYHSNYYGEDYNSKRRSGGSKNAGNPFAIGYNYKNYNPAYSQPPSQRTENQNNYPEDSEYDTNSNYGLPLGPGSPRSPPPAPTTRMNYLPATPATPSPFLQPQPLFLTPVREETFQPFAMEAPTWPSYPTTNEPPTQNLSPEPTGLGLGLRDGSRSPNPFIARMQSRATSPSQPAYPAARSPQPVYGEILYSTPTPISPRPEVPPATPPEAYGNFGFATPRTEAGMISPLHLPRA